MSRVEERTNKHFDAVNNRFYKIEIELESIHHEINACKLKKDTISLFIKKKGNPPQRKAPLSYNLTLFISSN